MNDNESIPFVMDIPQPTLRQIMEARGIPVLERQLVAEKKAAFIKKTRLPVIGYLFVVITNGYLTAIAEAAILLIGFFTGHLTASIWVAYGVAITYLIGNHIFWIRTTLHTWGAHWRSSRVSKNEFGQYVFLGNESRDAGFSDFVRASPTVIPKAATKLINQAEEIPGVTVWVEYAAFDPFLVARRGILGEAVYFYHWE